jgi:hypothetical protein
MTDISRAAISLQNTQPSAALINVTLVVEMAGKIVTGTRGYATLQARSIINKWLEKHPAQKH